MYLNAQAMFALCPKPHGSSTWLTALLFTASTTNEHEPANIEAALLRHDRLQYVLLKLRGRICEAHGDLDDCAFALQVEIGRKRSLPAELPLTVVLTQSLYRLLAEFSHKRVRGFISGPRT
ncbi:MAG: hypothetical protein QMB52_07560 [Propionivibrio sp.]